MSDLETNTAGAVEPEHEAAPAPTRRMVLNMGPQHPSTHGVLRIILELDGEIVRRAEPDIGFLHTGIEKQAEALNWQQVVTLTDRMDYLVQPRKQPGLRPAGGETAADRDPAPRAVDAGDADRTFAHQQPSGVAGHACPGPRRDDGLFLLLP